MILSNLSAINVDVAWSMVPSTSISTSFDTKGLGNLRTKANVAFDMFLDPSQANATSTTAPAYEVMIWLGSVGAVYPIGYDLRTASQPSMKMGNTLLSLPPPYLLFIIVLVLVRKLTICKHTLPRPQRQRAARLLLARQQQYDELHRRHLAITALPMAARADSGEQLPGCGAIRERSFACGRKCHVWGAKGYYGCCGWDAVCC